MQRNGARALSLRRALKRWGKLRSGLCEEEEETPASLLLLHPARCGHVRPSNKRNRGIKTGAKKECLYKNSC
jgi:hypothetical protein